MVQAEWRAGHKKAGAGGGAGVIVATSLTERDAAPKGAMPLRTAVIIRMQLCRQLQWCLS